MIFCVIIASLALQVVASESSGQYMQHRLKQKVRLCVTLLDPPGQDVSAALRSLKSLLATIFKRYQSQMQDLRLATTSLERRVEDLERSVGDRLGRIEEQLVSRPQRRTGTGASSRTVAAIPSQTGDLERRVGKLEELSMLGGENTYIFREMFRYELNDPLFQLLAPATN